MSDDHPIEIRSLHHQSKPKAQYPLSFIPVSELFTHEEIIQHEIQHVITSLKETGILNTPILVSKEGVILDGHHRFAALKKLGAVKVPAIVVDYKDPELIKVGTWYPIISNSPKEVIPAFKSAGLKVEEADASRIDEVLSRKFAAYAGNKSEGYLLFGDRDLVFKIFRDNWVERARFADSENLALEKVGKGTTFISWSYTKEEIIERAKSNRPFLPKTTRHFLKYQFPDYPTKIEKLLNRED